jgi:hypothetical protein
MPSAGASGQGYRCELAAGEFDEEGLAGAGEGAEEAAVGGDAGEGGCGAALEGLGEGVGRAGDQERRACPFG